MHTQTRSFDPDLNWCSCIPKFHNTVLLIQHGQYISQNRWQHTKETWRSVAWCQWHVCQQCALLVSHVAGSWRQDLHRVAAKSTPLPGCRDFQSPRQAHCGATVHNNMMLGCELFDTSLNSPYHTHWQTATVKFLQSQMIKLKVKGLTLLLQCGQIAHLHFLGLEPIHGTTTTTTSV